LDFRKLRLVVDQPGYDTIQDIPFSNAKMELGLDLVIGYAGVNENVIKMTFKIKIICIPRQQSLLDMDPFIRGNSQFCEPLLEGFHDVCLGFWVLGVLESQELGGNK
jgi:hypothetical protein